MKIRQIVLDMIIERIKKLQDCKEQIKKEIDSVYYDDPAKRTQYGHDMEITRDALDYLVELNEFALRKFYSQEDLK